MDDAAGLGKQLLKGLKWVGMGIAGLVVALAAWIGLYQFTDEAQVVVVVATGTPTPTATPTPTDTPTMTPTPTATFTPTPTDTPTPTPIPTDTPTPTATPTITPSPTPTLLYGRIIVLVTRVLSGNLIEVAQGDERYLVRYLMVDTPAIDEPGGGLALQRNSELVAEQLVYLEPDGPDVDGNGHKLRYVFLPDEQFVNEILLNEGYGRFVMQPGATRREYTLRQAQVGAMVSGLGQWGTPTPTPGPTATPTLTPIPAVELTPYASGGLGLSRQTWNATHVPTGQGTTLGDIPATIYDNLYAVLFVGERVAWIDRRWPADGGVSMAEAEALAGNLMPSDRLFIRVYYPPELGGAAVNIYYSPSLAARFPDDAWIGDSPGTFAAVFENNGAGSNALIQRMVIMLNDPVAVLQNFSLTAP